MKLLESTWMPAITCKSSSSRVLQDVVEVDKPNAGKEGRLQMKFTQYRISKGDT